MSMYLHIYIKQYYVINVFTVPKNNNHKTDKTSQENIVQSNQKKKKRKLKSNEARYKDRKFLLSDINEIIF